MWHTRDPPPTVNTLFVIGVAVLVLVVWLLFGAADSKPNGTNTL